MILQNLVDEFCALFGRFSDRRIVLWFDEKREFERLLPKFETYLAGLALRPFALLRYDEAAGHGQLWIKHEIHWAKRHLTPTERDALRYVIYLPFAPERLDGPEEEGGWSADLLLEYRNLGAVWLVDGKKATLFGFLRKIGVNLPADPKEQRQLWEGGHNSLLAKFTARLAERDARFLQQPITPAWVRVQVIGDVEQTLLDLAAEPADKFAELAREGLVSDFVQQVREAFGFPHPLVVANGAPASEVADSVNKWLTSLVLHLALTETFEGYGEPVDFPHQELLPETPYRKRCVDFLRRWLKDSSAAAHFDRHIRQVERGGYDLSKWAKGRAGNAVAFPHLIRLRFQTLYDEFRAVAGQKTQYGAFLTRHAKHLAEEVEYTKSSPDPVPGFDLLRRLGQLVSACEEAASRAGSCATAEEVLHVYIEYAGQIDRKHWRLVADCAKEMDLEDLLAVANRAYDEYLEALNAAFFEGLRERSEWKLSGIRSVTEVAADVWNARAARAVVIVDALRFDCAIEIRERLRLPESALVPALACIPTRTWAGMIALLPLGGEQVRYETGPGEGRMRLAATNANLSDRQVRLQLLRDRVRAVCMEIEEVESGSRAPKPLPEVLCVFGHETIDSLGHEKASDLIRHLDTEVERLILVIGKLHRWGYPEVHLLTDHGFVTTSGESEQTIVPFPADRAIVAKSRYALVEGGVAIEAKTFPFPLDPLLRVAAPAGMAFFKSEKTFAHGGVTLQEVVTPHLASRRETIPTRVGVQVVPAAYEVRTYSLKVVIEPVLPEAMDLFTRPVGRTVEVDLQRPPAATGAAQAGASESVLARTVQREVKPEAGQKVAVVLMLKDTMDYKEGEMLDLIVRDVETREVLSPTGLRLTVARSMKP
ncbi:MAG: PglZ domain-containing protein [candidate division NC10 bacterium]|nr:PglZ domain-containing protein [candidate division NC10 bacterium]